MDLGTAPLFDLTGPPGTGVIVRPVIDLNGHQPVDSYEIPDRIRRQVTLRDHHCVFPHCTRPAESCDLDLTGRGSHPPDQ